MAVELIETTESRDFRLDAASAEGTWRYVARVTSEADPEAALDVAVRATAPFFWNGLARQSIQATPRGGGVYTVEVPYRIERPNTSAPDPIAGGGAGTGPGGGAASSTPPTPGSDNDPIGPNVTLEIGGRPPKLLTSLATLDSGGLGPVAPPGALVPAPDHKRSINVVDGEVEGVEIDDPASVLTMTYKFDSVVWGTVRRWQSMVWKTNNGTWRRFARREVAFIGASLSTTDDARVSATFRFGLRPETTIAAGKLRDDGTNKLPQYAVTFRGWDYLWVSFEERVDANRTVRRPKFFYVEQVLEEEDFLLLGIGG